MSAFTLVAAIDDLVGVAARIWPVSEDTDNMLVVGLTSRPPTQSFRTAGSTQLIGLARDNIGPSIGVDLAMAVSSGTIPTTIQRARSTLGSVKGVALGAAGLIVYSTSNRTPIRHIVSRDTMEVRGAAVTVDSEFVIDFGMAVQGLNPVLKLSPDLVSDSVVVKNPVLVDYLYVTDFAMVVQGTMSVPFEGEIIPQGTGQYFFWS